MELQRCFVTLELPREIVREIRKIQKLIWKKTLFTGKLTEEQNIHLTLKFLSEIDKERVEEVKKRLKDVRLDGFEAELGEAGVFSKKFIRIIWIELKGRGVFKLQKEIDEKLKDLFDVEERFMSHITIARAKNVRDKKELIEYLESIKPEKRKFKINNFYLKKSELTAEGPVYEELEMYKLE